MLAFTLVRSAALAALIIAASNAATAGRADENQAARSILTTALDRLGGADHLRNQRTWFVAGTGEENLSAELQGLTPDEETVRPHEEWLGVDQQQAAVAWERRTPRNDHSVRWRRFLYGRDSTGFIVWTDSVSVMRAGATPMTRRRGMMRRIPQLLLLDAASADSLRVGTTRMLGGKRHQEVRALLDDGWISLWISADSSLLNAAEYQTELPGRGGVTVRWEWRDWRRERAGVLRPGGHRVVIDGRTFQTVAYRRFEVAGPAADSLLRIPNEIRSRPRPMAMSAPATADSALPVSGEVA
ncbi:MAG: hypothetical protein AB1762_22130, partial [Gemmatimonadota bacterium]